MDGPKSLMEREEDLRGTREPCRRTDSTAIEDEGRQAVGMLYLYRRGALALRWKLWVWGLDTCTCPPVRTLIILTPYPVLLAGVTEWLR